MINATGRKKPAGLAFCSSVEKLLLGNSGYRASTCARKAGDAYCFIAFGLSVFIEGKCGYRADTYTCTTSDTCILINCYWHS